MKINILLATTLFTCIVQADTAPAKRISPESQLSAACAALQRDPLSLADVQTLRAASTLKDFDSELRSRAMAVYTLSLLLQGDTNSFERAHLAFRTAFPDAADKLVTVTCDDAFSPCDACAGKGVITTICPICRGLGKCKTCDATGIKDGAPCPTCKGKGTCALCAGKRHIDAPCSLCRGTRRLLKPDDALRTNYGVLLAAIIARVDENARFADLLAKAEKETDLDKQAGLLHALLGDFSKRSDLSDAQRLLADTTNKLRTKEKKRLAKEAQDREAKELDAMRERATSQSLDDTIAAISAYLNANPNVSTSLELQALRNELIATRNTRRLIRNIAIAVGVVVLATFLAFFIRPLLLRGPRKHIGPLPGMGKIDAKNFTDPLTLNAKESKSRVKTKTANIPPPKTGV